MATNAKLRELDAVPSSTQMPDKTHWSELQKIQFMLGVWDGVPGSSVKKRELPEWKWIPNDEWKKGQGILDGHPEHDTSRMKADNRAEEEEHDARKFGWSREQ